MEGEVTAVQDFYYESKYVHNHFIQMLAESGVVGLAAFLFLLGSAYWTVLRRWDRGDDPVYAAMFACLMMMTFHSMVEVTWSHQEYQATVMLVFAAICALPDNFLALGKRPEILEDCGLDSNSLATAARSLVDGIKGAAHG